MVEHLRGGRFFTVLRVGEFRFSRMKETRAFTIIELLAVIAIIVTLAGIGVPAYMSWRNRSKIEKSKAIIAKLEMAVEMYRTDFGTYPDFLYRLKDVENSANRPERPYIDGKDYNAVNKKFYDPWKAEYGYSNTNETVTITSSGLAGK